MDKLAMANEVEHVTTMHRKACDGKWSRTYKLGMIRRSKQNQPIKIETNDRKYPGTQKQTNRESTIEKLHHKYCFYPVQII